MDDGWSVQDAASRLACSESTVRRRVDAGTLTAVDAAVPLRITKESLATAQREMLHRMGLAHPDDIRELADNPSGVTTGPDEIERLQNELTLVQGALADLTAAHATLLDTFRRLSDGAVPNN
jgi:hypothetical protein